jgi:citrate synthase
MRIAAIEFSSIDSIESKRIMSERTLTITDNRTGKTYTLPIENGTVRAMDLRQIKTGADDFGLMTYDPALMNTASTKSAITFIDGDKGILEYRGYPSNNSLRSASFWKSRT